MHYYIDGYNLLFRSHSGNVDANDFRSCRESLIDILNAKIAGLKLHVTVVFDSQYIPGEGSRSHFKHLEILYTPSGMTADDFILRELQFCPAPERKIVITSDKLLAAKARHCNARTESIDEFLGWLNKRHKNKLKPGKPKHPKPKPKASPAPAAEESLLAQPELPVVIKSKDLPPGSVEYYLAQFEKNLEGLSHVESKKPLSTAPKRQPKRKKKNIVVAEKHTGLSEEERWLKIFQERDQSALQ